MTGLHSMAAMHCFTIGMQCAAPCWYLSETMAKVRKTGDKHPPAMYAAQTHQASAFHCVKSWSLYDTGLY